MINAGTIVHLVTAPVEDILYPATCPICGMPIRRGVDFCCAACDRRLVRLPHPVCALCHRYLMPHGLGCTCDDGRAFPQRVAALGIFDPAWRAMVHGLKYHGCRALARPLAKQMADRLGLLPAIDAIVAVPTAPHRRRERGFGHAELLAEHLADWSRQPYLPDAIGFTRRVSDQTRLSGEARKANLDGAFKPLNLPLLSGKSVLIVDDVMTTGATIAEAGRILLEAGAARVYGSIIALNHGHVPDGPGA